ncbi:MAG TPA: hypothetical protein VKW04_19440 [Planctomycetota bacterium]|nr:hypothetical protein [Planctomycetota bacterium]
MGRGATLALLLLLACSTPATRVPGRLKVEPFLGADPALHFIAADAKILAVAIPQAGGRVVHYSLDGDNILYNPMKNGQPQPGGGYGLDLGPERTIPPHPALWTGKHAWAMLGDIVTITSLRDPAVGLRVEKNLMIDGATGALDILQRMKNGSDGERAWCFWDRTLCRAGGFGIIPLNPKSRFPAKWVLGTRRGPLWWEYNGTNPSHPGVKVLDGVLVTKAEGPEQKVGADSDAGWIAYIRGSLLFVKYFPYVPDGDYVDNGLSVAHYFNDTIAELEPLSPEARLKPEGEFTFPEHWTLSRLSHEVTTHEEARAVAATIPRSPFAP